jgi:hypothetical protein
MQLLRHVLFIVIIPFLAHSQRKPLADYLPGYCISLSGDTLHGAIASLNIAQSSQWCQFKNDSIFTYHPENIKGYRYSNGRYFVSKKIPGKREPLFIECLVEGYLSAFLFTDTASHFYISRSNEGLIEVPYKEGSKYIENSEYHVAGGMEGWYYTRSAEHIPLLVKQLSDVPQLSERIKRTKTINRHVFTNLIKEYNNLRCDSTHCVVYKTNEPSIRVSLEPVGGLIRFRGIQKTFSQYGIIGSFSFPNDNLKIQVRAGILYTRLDYSGIGQLYQLPLQLQYPISYKNTITRIRWGFNFWKINLDGPPNWTTSVGSEILLKINKRIYASFGSGVETLPLTFIIPEYKPDTFPFNVLAVSLQIGASFQF